MNAIRTLAVMLLGSAFLAGCGSGKEDSSAEMDVPAPATEMEPLPEDETSPADSADAMPSETVPSGEPDPAMSDTLPTAENPPPMEPAPPPSR